MARTPTPTTTGTDDGPGTLPPSNHDDEPTARARQTNMAVIPVYDEDGTATGAYQVMGEDGTPVRVELGAGVCECDANDLCIHQRRVAIMVNETPLPGRGGNVGQYLKYEVAHQMVDYETAADRRNTPTWVEDHLALLSAAREMYLTTQDTAAVDPPTA